MDRGRLVIASVATVLVIILVSVWISGMLGGASLARKAILMPGDIEGDGWTYRDLNEGDLLMDVQGLSSYCEVMLSEGDLAAFVAVYEFESAEQAIARYQYALDLFGEWPHESFDVGDMGALIMHINGNGTCHVFFHQNNFYVEMALLSGYDGSPRVNDDQIRNLALELAYAQDLKICSVT